MKKLKNGLYATMNLVIIPIRLCIFRKQGSVCLVCINPAFDSLENQTKLEKLNEMNARLDREQQEKVELLNLTVRQKQWGQYRLGIIAGLATLMLLLIIY